MELNKKICPICNKEFQIEKDTKNNGIKYCSDECKKMANKEAVRKYRAKKKTTKVAKNLTDANIEVKEKGNGLSYGYYYAPKVVVTIPKSFKKKVAAVK